MKLKPSLWAMLAVLVLIGGVASFLGRIRTYQRLGEPGLRMIEEPVLSEEGQIINTHTVALPTQVLDFESTNGRITKVELGWLPGDTTYARRHYRARDKFNLTLNVVLMGQDRTSIHRPEICLTGQGWTIEQTDLLEIPIGPPQSYRLPVVRMIARRRWQDASGGTHLVKAVYVFWFVADDRVTAQHGQRMWWMAKDLLTTGVLERWAYVSCLAIGLPGQEAALYSRMERFIAAAVPEFQLATRESLLSRR